MRSSGISLYRVTFALVVGAASLLMMNGSAALGATTVTNWTGLSGDSLWVTPGNWDNGEPASAFSATFNGAGNGDTSISLSGAAQPVNTVAFSGALTAAYTIGTTAGDTLNFDANGAISVASTVTTSQIISAAINTNTTGAISVSNLSTTGLLTLSGQITGGGGITTAAGGGGVIQFAGNNNYSGATTLSSNSSTTLQVASDTAFGTGTLIFNNTSNSAFQAFGGDRTIANPVTFNFGFTLTNAATPHNVTFTGPMAFAAAGRTLTVNTYGQVATLGSAATPSTITLPTGTGTTANFNPSNNGSSAATLVINDVIQDATPAPATAAIVQYSSNGNNTPEGNLLITGANTYAGATTFAAQTTGTFIAMNVGIGVSSVGNPGSITSGPFGKGTVTFNNGNAPPVLVPYGADRTVANALTLTSGFFAANAPTTGTGITVDPAGTTHNLFLTGPISDPGKVITNSMSPGVAMYLGSSTTSSTITMTGATKFQTQLNLAGAGTTIIYDKMTSTGSLTVQNKAIVQIAGNTNDYSGGTSVTSGSLLVTNTSGSATGSGAVGIIGAGTGAAAVGTGGTLGGTGFPSPGLVTIGSTTAASQGGIVAPGMSGPGTLNVASMIWDPFGRYAFERNETDNTIGAGVNDLISGSGSLDLTALSAAAPFDLNLTSVVSGAGPTTYTLATFASIISGGTPYVNGTDVSNLFTFSGTVPANPDVMVVAGPSGVGQALQFSSVAPEPASLGLLGLAALATLRRRRA